MGCDFIAIMNSIERERELAEIVARIIHFDDDFYDGPDPEATDSISTDFLIDVGDERRLRQLVAEIRAVGPEG